MFFLPTMIALLYELFLAIPILGGTVVIGSGYSALTVALVIHIIVLVLRFVTGHSKIVPIIAIVLTLLTWVPFLGWAIHSVLALAYFIDLIVGLIKGREN